MQFVCKNCFKDQELIGLIISQGKIGKCDCCDSNDVEVILIEELYDFFNELYLNFQIKEDGESLNTLISENWNLFNGLEIGRKILNFTLEKLVSDIHNSDELVCFSDDILENINYWDELKEKLKWKIRYFSNIRYIIEDLGWDSFFESKTKLKSNDVFFRARLHVKADERTFEKDEMLSPPKEKTLAGRANPLGIPYLYLSDNADTILYEVRASYLDEVSVASFKLKDTVEDPIIISDFTETPTLYDPGRVNLKIKSTLLKKIISRELSKPMRRYDSDLDYVPTQFICEFIKEFTNVQGIKFKSSLHEEGSNLVLFNQEIMDCFDVKQVRISKVLINSCDI